MLLAPCGNVDDKRSKEAAHHGREEGGDHHREGEEGHILPGEVDDHDEAR